MVATLDAASTHLGVADGLAAAREVTGPLSGTELWATDREPAEPDREAAEGDPCLPELSPRPPGGL